MEPSPALKQINPSLLNGYPRQPWKSFTSKSVLSLSVCMCVVCTYVCIYTQTYICPHIHACIYVYIYMWVCVCMCICIRVSDAFESHCLQFPAPKTSMLPSDNNKSLTHKDFPSVSSKANYVANLIKFIWFISAAGTLVTSALPRGVWSVCSPSKIITLRAKLITIKHSCGANVRSRSCKYSVRTSTCTLSNCWFRTTDCTKCCCGVLWARRSICSFTCGFVVTGEFPALRSTPRNGKPQILKCIGPAPCWTALLKFDSWWIRAWGFLCIWEYIHGVVHMEDS